MNIYWLIWHIGDNFLTAAYDVKKYSAVVDLFKHSSVEQVTVVRCQWQHVDLFQLMEIFNGARLCGPLFAGCGIKPEKCYT